MRLFKKTLFCFLTLGSIGVFFTSPARSQNITTIAGGGPISFLGNGGPATLASIGGPNGLAFDSQGNLYISDPGYVLIRKVDMTTGIITTVAGDGTFNTGSTGDGGPATLARFNYPTGIALDAQDNLYISDFLNNRVRKVSAVGQTITTVVGNGIGGYSGDNGPATLAQIQNPENLKFDSQGNLYIADFSNHVVRKVSSISGTITGACTIITLVGNGISGSLGDGGPALSAELKNPEALVFDAFGNLFIADDGNFNIRKVAAGSSTITAVAGSAGVTGFTPDGGLASSANLSSELDGLAVGCGGNLYFADDFNHRVRMISGSPATLTTVAGTGTPGYSSSGPALSALLNHPEVIAFSQTTGDLFVANYSSGTVQKIISYCTLTPTPTPTATFTVTPTPTATAVGCGKPIETYFYPNPASGNTATILCNLCEPGQVSVRIYNTVAELVETYLFHGNMGANNLSVNIGGLSHGIYYYVVQAQGSAGTHKSNTAKFAVVR